MGEGGLSPTVRERERREDKREKRGGKRERREEGKER